MTRLLLAAALLAWAPARAGQEDPRLEMLFERLQRTDDRHEAAAAVSTIWAIWLSYPGDNDDVRLLLRRGVDATDARDLEQAEAAFSGVIALAPDFAEGWNQRATVRYMGGDYDGSIADIRVTLALEPRHFGALAGLGLCYIELGETQRAIAALEAALAVNPHLDGARATLDRLNQTIEGEPI